MLDIKVVRAQPDKVKAAMKARNKDMDELIDQVLDIDVQRREITAKAESMKAQQNLTSKKIPQIKKEGGDVSIIMAEMKQLADQVKAYMRNNVQSVYGDWNFNGMNVCAKSGTSQLGGGQKSNAMFAGFVQDDRYPLAFIVVVEEGGYGSQTAAPIAGQVLSACIEDLNGTN